MIVRLPMSNLFSVAVWIGFGGEVGGQPCA